MAEREELKELLGDVAYMGEAGTWTSQQEAIAKAPKRFDAVCAERDRLRKGLEPSGHDRLAFALCLTSSHANLLNDWPCDYHKRRAESVLTELENIDG